ncbi:hypothetical protein Lacal_0715 [Lacinutrix sp. 5H-3-7-4]|nr:hypothetical protein Lacal_0715 [Lacinutrix sp. 5H-3-7-4]
MNTTKNINKQEEIKEQIIYFAIRVAVLLTLLASLA